MAKKLSFIKKGYKNAKVKNATPKEYKGIKFKSILEVTIYKFLESLKNTDPSIEFSYETFRAKIWDASSFEVPYYDKFGRRPFGRITSKPLAVHYTPDFVVRYKGHVLFLEVKGWKNSVVPYKIRLFRQWLDEYQKNVELKCCYAVVYSKKDLITLLSELDND